MAEAISSGNIIQEPLTTIDPRFFSPPGVIDVRPRTIDESPGVYSVDEGATFSVNEDITPAGTVNDPGGTLTRLTVPSYITVVEQVVRFNPDGTQVVDVTVEVEDVEGATNYDVKVAKA